MGSGTQGAAMAKCQNGHVFRSGAKAMHGHGWPMARVKGVARSGHVPDNVCSSLTLQMNVATPTWELATPTWGGQLKTWGGEKKILWNFVWNFGHPIIKTFRRRWIIHMRVNLSVSWQNNLHCLRLFNNIVYMTLCNLIYTIFYRL